MNVCLYGLNRIVNYAFNYAMMFIKVVVYEPTRVSELLQPIFGSIGNAHRVQLILYKKIPIAKTGCMLNLLYL